MIKSRYLEAKPLKFSPPKSLCGTVGSPWVSLATLFGFWETLMKIPESRIEVFISEDLQSTYIHLQGPLEKCGVSGSSEAG